MDAALDLLRAFLREHPAEAARELERLDPAEAAAILADAEPEDGAPVLLAMSAMAAGEALERMETLSAVALVCRLETPVAAMLLRRTAMPVRRNVMTACPEPWKATLTAALRAPAHTVGAVMDARAAALPMDWTVDEATAHLAVRPALLALELFVVDREHKLKGRVDLRRLDGSRAARTLSGVMVPDPDKLPARASIRFVGDDPLWERFDALPVVDENGLLVGTLSHRAVRGWRRPGKEVREEAPGSGFVELAELAWRGYIAAVDVVSTVTGVATEEAETLGGGDAAQN